MQTSWLQDLLVQYLEVSKRIAVYLARTSAQQTVDHLAYEIAQLLHAPGNAPPRAPPSDELYEFRHEHAPAPRRDSHAPPAAPQPERPHHARSASNPSTASARVVPMSWACSSAAVKLHLHQSLPTSCRVMSCFSRQVPMPSCIKALQGLCLITWALK